MKKIIATLLACLLACTFVFAGSEGGKDGASVNSTDNELTLSSFDLQYTIINKTNNPIRVEPFKRNGINFDRRMNMLIPPHSKMTSPDFKKGNNKDGYLVLHVIAQNAGHELAFGKMHMSWSNKRPPNAVKQANAAVLREIKASGMEELLATDEHVRKEDWWGEHCGAGAIGKTVTFKELFSIRHSSLSVLLSGGTYHIWTTISSTWEINEAG
jgi:hypothetical protein